MPPKIDESTRDALQALAEQDVQGPMSCRGEFAMDAVMDAAINAMAREIGGRNARSKAIRELITRGAARTVGTRAR